MKIEVFEEEPQPEEKVVRLALRKESNFIVLQAVNKFGVSEERGNLIIIHPDGKFVLACVVNRELGFPLDTWGRVTFSD